MVGKRLRLLRTERNITQEQLGKILGVGKTAISQYENSVRRPDAVMIRHMAEFFNVSTDYLLGLENHNGDNHEKAGKLPTEARLFLKDFEEFILTRYCGNNGGSALPHEDPELTEFMEEFNRRDDLRLLFKQLKTLPPEAVRQITSLVQMIKENH